MFKHNKTHDKPNFVNKHMEKKEESDNMNYGQVFGGNLTDKLLRPGIAGAIGAAYYGYTYGGLREMSYMLNKFGMVAGSALVADYLGNIIVDSSYLKSFGLRKLENMIIEPVFTGVGLALLNKYYLGVPDKFAQDLMVGGGSDLLAGFATAPLMRMIF